MIDEPEDIEVNWPRPMTREAAQRELADLLGPSRASLAQDVWDTLLSPLYDLLAAKSRYPSRGHCLCGAVHPSWKLPNYTGKRTKHRMTCPHYTGPLKHHRVQALNESFFASGGAQAYCACGKRYPYWADEEKRIVAACPDILFVWRGERPDPQEDAVSEHDEVKTNQQVQDEQGVASDSQAAVQAEQDRLEALAAKGQIGEDQRESDTEDEDHEPNDDETADKADADDEKAGEGQSYNR